MGVKDKLITVAAIWLSITLAAVFVVVVDYQAITDPDYPAAQIWSLVLLFALVALYANATGPGRRTGAATYLVTAILCPVVPFATLAVETSIEHELPVSIERRLFAPYAVGIPGERQGDIVFADRIFASFPNIFLPILAVVLLRSAWCFFRDTSTANAEIPLLRVHGS